MVGGEVVAMTVLKGVQQNIAITVPVIADKNKALELFKKIISRNIMPAQD